ncbi:5,10-methylene tetrahydromethanopterin reductase [Marmoricola sp. Leaf446]|uniref:LLM class flavin-dependent oxidoreductase n=1 Tax=Marmoricola sp. Leaf446 TaxID=1736379 RepID=UPI0006F7D150|nr:LLM class flavin-dependent oxidoreductase [Marmoricola sp. Leaf446]KQT91981.1 5,10-methylene tetrahydromethanopterin reductase [Marmoricola sp. Leaf446]
MPDLGHELRFGIFPSPDAARREQTLKLALLADVSGLDLVSVQDHPYQARHLDAWTLLSVVAARTRSITVAPNVANLPLRPPVVLARSVASLDLLSGGRVELGLGTGAFWDAVVAAGGPRRTPGEAVDALLEAVRIVRTVWAGGTVREEGEHYRVRGLHGGPRPAHDVPIWLGAYGPRMLRVTADVADAWIPSMGYADPPALAAMNARIDEQATANGRGPEAIVRMYNLSGRFGTGTGFLDGGVRDWVEQLAGLALDEGISGFVLGTDDADDVRRFALEVAPAVRALVTEERALRAGGTASAPSVDERGSSTGETVQVVPTPPPTTRHAGRLPWDEGTRPTYPVPAGAAYSSAQQAHPQHLVDVHDALRAELGQLRDVVDQVRRGLLQVGQARSVVNTMTMRQNNWTLGAYCESYCRIVTGHHTLEDRSVFTHLRRSDAAVGPVLDRLHEEHEVIAGVLEDVDRALVGLVSAAGSGTSPALETLSGTVDLLTDVLLSHLSYEERELLHPLAQHGMT